MMPRHCPSLNVTADRYINVNLATIRHHCWQNLFVYKHRWKSKHGLILRNDNYESRHKSCQIGEMTRIKNWFRISLNWSVFLRSNVNRSLPFRLLERSEFCVPCIARRTSKQYSALISLTRQVLSFANKQCNFLSTCARYANADVFCCIKIQETKSWNEVKKSPFVAIARKFRISLIVHSIKSAEQ